MDKVAVFPGTFDPFTVGHEALVKRALKLFDRVVIAVGKNLSKKTLFDIDQRLAMVNDVFAGEPRVEIVSYEGLTVDFCHSIGAHYLLRGLRTAADFEYERAIGQVNKAMRPDIETIFLLTAPEHTPVNSTIVRDILVNKGDASKFLPSAININKYLSR
ncbi:MAG: pantetheine-phosphate adenylyltransferase [Tenuifilaceae bacterium]|jgi:pantetheine-phosphate adenylyltransferase|uniref:pantetheine-phosphate adenylyltransferase n=1 Tax=Perlabentimonas gracilis TaxID=2715279 RepID=UPI00140CA0A2|nr:pantetheine-phosphate adenylyltransferase [Perlabentimonas gracilis]MDX9770419.1 pantetheine-phosphate adenylyltransferase [Tenuifilaceae bacterium]NHB68277.1 pantetheine-phosphate adenylyltransferase [Perlabentimonas gracilis]